MSETKSNATYINMIPRRIHYCWFGNAPMKDLHLRCLDSWQHELPEYEFKLWNEANSPLGEWYTSEAARRGYWSRLSNYVRLHALYLEGGIYLDTDVEVLKSFDPLLVHSCFLGFQQQHEDCDWVNTAILGAHSGHPFLKRCQDYMVDALRTTSRFLRGPETATAVLRESGLIAYGRQNLEGGIALFPAEFFSPCPWFDVFRADQITVDTVCIHHWCKSWCDTAEDQAFL
jgi:mannosyltransferase OCH1-like enzyme